MTAKSLLAIGGTRQISVTCVREATTQGLEVTVLNRGSPSLRTVPPSAESIKVDARDEQAVATALGSRHFDGVVDFLSFTPEQVLTAVRLFGSRADQYVFISSASAYQKPPPHLPISETTPLFNPFS